MVLFDTHAHYTDTRFEREYPGGLEGALADAKEAGVSYIVNAGTDVESSREVLALADRFGLYGTVGIHPSDSRFCSDDASEIDAIRTLLAHPRAVAIGEIGLDYHYEDTNREKQHLFFERQMALAEETGYPVVIHDREAHGDTVAMIRRFPTVTGVLHSFSGSAEMAEELVSLGWYVSFSGTVTFTNARKVREAAAVVPKERILLETDCPYLAPHPHRGKMNSSHLLPLTAQAVAEVHGVSPHEIARITTENAFRIFRISETL